MVEPLSTALYEQGLGFDPQVPLPLPPTTTIKESWAERHWPAILAQTHRDRRIGMSSRTSSPQRVSGQSQKRKEGGREREAW